MNTISVQVSLYRCVFVVGSLVASKDARPGLVGRRFGQQAICQSDNRHRPPDVSVSPLQQLYTEAANSKCE